MGMGLRETLANFISLKLAVNLHELIPNPLRDAARRAVLHHDRRQHLLVGLCILEHHSVDRFPVLIAEPPKCPPHVVRVVVIRIVLGLHVVGLPLAVSWTGVDVVHKKPVTVLEVRPKSARQRD